MSGSIWVFRDSTPRCSFRRARTRGIRVVPPTITTSSTPRAVRPTSSKTRSTGIIARSKRSEQACSNSSRVTVSCVSTQLAGAHTSASPPRMDDAPGLCTMQRTSEYNWSESRRLSSSLSGYSRCCVHRWASAMAPLQASTRRKVPASTRSGPSRAVRWCARHWSKSDPPRWSSPSLASTSTLPSLTKSTETSSVPPPKSYTRMWCTSGLRCSPYASAAAVGSSSTRITRSPACRYASAVI
mmetsp:Transcript_44553/g.69669  ORF Transcript_44553/g.69669 Transcript_44553/m.69669 type:complete len:241 (+) Transcript_44553:567-1289(+)